MADIPERSAVHDTGGIVCGSQIRAARALLGLTRAQLARAAGLHPNSVKYWESFHQIPTPRDIGSGLTVGEPFAVNRIRKTLAHHGVETFSSPSPGVRFVR